MNAASSRRGGDRHGRGRVGTAVVLFAVAAVGLVGTWTFNLRYALVEGGGDYLGAWFTNGAASSAAVDLVVVTAAASVVYWRERHVLPGRLPWALLFIPLSIVVAVSFALPLFLGLRELALRSTSPSPTPEEGASP